MNRLSAIEEVVKSLVLTPVRPVWSPLFLDDAWSRDLINYKKKYEDASQNWVLQADINCLPSLIDIYCNPPDSEEWDIIRVKYPNLSLDYEDNDLNEDLMLLLARWGRFNPSLVIPQLGVLLKQPDCRENVLRTFSYIHSDQTLVWIDPILVEVGSMSELEISLLISSLKKINNKQANQMLERLLV